MRLVMGAGASANKSPMSEITAANKQAEAARDGLSFFLGHKANQINQLFELYSAVQ